MSDNNKKWPPLFKRIEVNRETTGIQIAKTQEEFEKFWRMLNRMCPPNSEKTLALRKMQEACMWFCRALAVDGFNPPADDKPAKKDPLGEQFTQMLQNELGCTVVDCKSEAATLASKNNEVLNPVIKQTVIVHKKARLKP